MTTATSNQPQAASWTRIQWLLLFGGVANLLILLYVAIRWGLSARDMLVVLGAASALAAYWQLRAGKTHTAWWLALVAAILSVLYFIVRFFVAGIIPVYDGLYLTVRYFSLNNIVFLLSQLSLIALVVAGVWALVVHLRDVGGKSGPQSVGSALPALFDAEGNRVMPVYAVQTSSLAIVAFVLVWLITPVGLILGYVARSEIRNSGGLKGGEGLASAAIILGWIFVAISVIAIGIIFASAFA